MQHAIQPSDPGGYAPPMAGHRVSATLDAETYKIVRELVAWKGTSLSAWLARAARRQAFFDERVRDLGEIQEEIGPFTEEDIRRADEYLDSIGVPRPPE
jgi:hypothetical protein